VHRGVAAWRDGANGNALRIFINSRYRLFAIDAKTGRPVESFGSHGSIDLSEGLVWAINKKHYTNTSPPVVYKDLVILGNGVGDASSTATIRRATSAPSTRTPAGRCGRSSRFRNPASSATTPGAPTRGVSPATPTRGRR
jgi:glucose dehydrogenase